MNYADRLAAAVRRCGNPALVGLDPHLDRLPAEFAEARDPAVPRARRAQRMGDFLEEVVGLVAGRVAAVKPQSAFFEVLGHHGVEQWERVVAAARAAGLLVVGDVKRSDIASTARAYARAFLEEEPRCDAITVNPLLGDDSIEPFLEACTARGAGLYVLVRTSNPGGAGIQHHGDPPLADVLARSVERWGMSRPELVGECGLSSVGAVVGATHRDELAHFRELLPHAPLLLPGYGAQGAGAEDVVPGFLRDAEGRPHGALVNASRSILFAPGDNWRAALSAALDEMIASLRSALDAGA